MHTQTHTPIHIHTPTHTPIHIYTHTHAHTHLYTYTQTRLHIYTYTHPHTYLYMHTPTHIPIHVHTYTCPTHTHTHTYVRAHTCLYTHTPWRAHLACSVSLRLVQKPELSLSPSCQLWSPVFPGRTHIGLQRAKPRVSGEKDEHIKVTEPRPHKEALPPLGGEEGRRGAGKGPRGQADSAPILPVPRLSLRHTGEGRAHPCSRASPSAPQPSHPGPFSGFPAPGPQAQPWGQCLRGSTTSGLPQIHLPASLPCPSASAIKSPFKAHHPAFPTCKAMKRYSRNTFLLLTLPRKIILF